ncbi:monovalent cation/H+ antiporter complex subunit F [Poriferisphaera corsica]|nr:monovalent cation/H+ antiporter complex subunit F [Poriferisphaera corsica]
MSNLNLANLLAAAPQAAEAAADGFQMSNSFAIYLLNLILWGGTISLVLGIIFCLLRILKGPHMADRVLAADTLSMQVLGLVVILTIVTRESMYFDVVLGVAIIGFASTVAFSQYIGARADEKMHAKDNKETNS